MHNVRRDHLDKLIAAGDDIEGGFTLQDEGLWVVANLAGMGCVNFQFVRLAEREGPVRLGYLEVTSLNGISPFESSQHADRYTERVRDITLKFSYVDGEGESQVKVYDSLQGLRLIEVVNLA